MSPTRRSRRFGFTALLLAAVALSSCSGDRETPPLPEEVLVGTWRAVLLSPGGELPFGLEIRKGDEAIEAVIHNGEEEAPLSGVEIEGRHVVLDAAWYDSTIDAELGEAGKTLRGSWQRTSAKGAISHLPFEAEKGRTERFLPVDAAGIDAVEAPSIDSVDGVWKAEFVDEDGREPARGEFRQRGDRVLGTFLTPTGDYRYLEGAYEGGVLRLSTFDGSHAFLFVARAQDDGSLSGDFWSRDTYHATWTAERAPDDARILPDGWTEVGLTNDEGRFRFAFEDLDGRVAAIYSGFAGPGTGQHYEELVEEIEALIEELLAAPAPDRSTAG